MNPPLSHGLAEHPEQEPVPEELPEYRLRSTLARSTLDWSLGHAVGEANPSRQTL